MRLTNKHNTNPNPVQETWTLQRLSGVVLHLTIKFHFIYHFLN